MLGGAGVGAVVLVTVGTWIVRAIAGADVVGFCRTSLASSTSFVLFLLHVLSLLGAVTVPVLLLVALARHGARRSLLPGLVSALVLWLYFAIVHEHLLPAPRHPCWRSDATPAGDAARRQGVRPA